MTKEAWGYRLKLSSDRGVTHAYGLLSQTVSGTIGTKILTTSATIDGASIVIGSIIKIGASQTPYTVDSIALPTTINTVQSLSATYGAGSGLRIDVVGTWAGSDGFNNAAIQSDGTKKPAFVPNIVNSLNAIEFNAGTKVLPIANNPLTDNIFEGGGTLICTIGIDTDGGNAAGRIIEKSTSGGVAAWNLVTTTAGGGFYRILFDVATTGTSGAWSTNSVLELTTPQIFSITYNSSTPTIPPIMQVIGIVVPITETSTPTGTVLDDSGGVYYIGNNIAGTRGLDGRILELYLYPYVLSGYPLSNMFLYLSNKWSVTLFDNTSQYYGGRNFFIRYPPSGTRKMLLALHGGGGSGLSFAFQLQLRAMFAGIAILCFPTATRNNAAAHARSWNSNTAPLEIFNSSPDSKYLKDLCEYVRGLALKRGIIIDEVYIIGHSNGGMMAYRLLIDHPDYFAGAFCMSADVMTENPDSFTGRIQHYHGESDENVPLAGGVGIEGNYYPPVFPAVSGFTKVNNGEGIEMDSSFVILPSPAAHTVSTLKTALALAPYSTTIQQVIYDFVYQTGYLITTQDGDFITTDDGDYIVTG